MKEMLFELANGVLRECMTLTIQTCNVFNPVSFSNAAVVLHPYVDLIHRPSVSLRRTANTPVLMCFDQIFDTNLLESIWNKKLDALDLKTTTLLTNALLPLLDFLHGRSIYNMVNHGITVYHSVSSMVYRQRMLLIL